MRIERALKQVPILERRIDQLEKELLEIQKVVRELKTIVNRRTGGAGG